MRLDDYKRHALKAGGPSFRFFCILALAAALICTTAYAQDRKPGEYQIKATFLYNFLKFVDWPKDTHTGDISICILGEDPFGDALDFIEGETLDSKTPVIRHLKRLHHLERCQVIFISRSEQEYVEDILKAVRGLNILTVGDTGGFAQKGVIINFYIEENKVRFEINLNALMRSSLQISSKVMKLARIVQD